MSVVYWKSVVHCKREDFDVYIGRGSPWGNPFSHKTGTKAKWIVSSREEAILSYKRHLWAAIQSGECALADLADLRGKTLGCYCHPLPCHGDVLVQAAEWAYNEMKGDSHA